MVIPMALLEIDVGDAKLRYLTYGPEDGTMALCLHGFPDTAHTFRYLSPHLADRGYRVVVPFMRGYAPSSVSSRHDYSVAALAYDAVRLHEALSGVRPALLIGHDWGAAAAYAASSAEPSRWHHVVTLSMPPLALFAAALGDYDQLRASWYMFFFQQPRAEAVVHQDQLAFLARLWADWSPRYDASNDLGLVREALAEPEHLRAALGYYRAMFTPLEQLEIHTAQIAAHMFDPPVVPTLYLHGELDGCIRADRLGAPLEYLAPGSSFEVLKEAGHFVHLERPDAVHTSIDRFLTP